MSGIKLIKFIIAEPFIYMRETNNESVWDVFLVFLRLGLTSFGGPVAHLGYFREEFVTRRHWLSDRSYSDLVALCQFLPGPASSQVGMALGLSQAGLSGAIAAWVGFTLPSAVALILFALGIASWNDVIPDGALHGLKIVAVAVVAQAIWGMAKSICTDTRRITLTAISACFVIMWPGTLGQIIVIITAAAISLYMFNPTSEGEHDPLPIALNRGVSIVSLTLFTALLVGLPIIVLIWPNSTLEIVDSFYRAGSLVFGGGHVVLPLLQAEVVPQGLVSNETFLAGYGATQAVPGPLFTFAAFLGASMSSGPSGWYGGIIALFTVFTPSFLLIVGVLPFWERMRRNIRMQAALIGINSAVVGLLLAAFYNPVWTSGITQSMDFGLAIIAFVALMYWKLPAWLVVVCGGLSGWLLSIVV